MILLVFLTIGMLAMAVLMLLTRKFYAVSACKVLIISVLLTLAGVAGTKILRFMEAGTWSGLSFFGAVFFAPILLLPVVWVLHMPCADLLDLCAPSECIMLTIMKFHCLYYHCCVGRILWHTTDGQAIRFPSQIVEMFGSFAIMLILICLIRSLKYRGQIYSWYMILYGVTRFILNCFRETTPFVWILPAGHFWSLVSIAVGCVWLCILKKCFQKNAVHTV